MLVCFLVDEPMITMYVPQRLFLSLLGLKYVRIHDMFTKAEKKTIKPREIYGLESCLRISFASSC